NQADEDVLAAGALCELLMVGRAVPCPRASANQGVRIHHDGAHEVTRPSLADSTQIAWRAYLEVKPNLATAIRSSENARRLLGIPELHEDVAFCSQLDIYPLVAKMDEDGAIRRLSERT